MKKYYYLMCMLFCSFVSGAAVHAQSFNSPSREKSVSDIENRTVYAVVTYNPSMDGYGVTTFKTGNQEDMTLLHEWGNSISILAGTAANGEYYGYLYQYDIFEGVLPIAISKISLRTGAITDVVDLSDLKFRIKFQDMTFDYSTNTMYGVGFDFGTSKLYIIDLEKGVITEGPSLKTITGEMTIATLAATYDGRMYGFNPNGVLYQIDKQTGNLTRILDTQLPLQSMQSMEFDHTDESLYWAADIEYPGNGLVNSLYKIDVEKKTFKSIGQLGGSGTRAVGMYIPFVRAGFGTPEQATDLSVTPASQGKEEAVITWKNPMKTHGGEVLTGNISVLLERDNEVISSSVSEPGAEMSWTDNDVKQGTHIYTVKAANVTGEGLRADYDAYVGYDVPGRTTDFDIVVGSECKSIKLAWSVPAEGLHGGYYKPSGVKYKIVRYPDNVVLEDDFSGTTYEDSSMKRLGRYYYGITASNEAGTSEQYIKSAVIAGKAMDLPYSIGFEDESVATNQWTFVNANNDESTWHLNSGFDILIYGQGYGSSGVEYIATSLASQLDADEWLISPPLNFEADKDYYLSFDTRSDGVEEFNITIGNLNNPESQNQLVKSGVFTETANKEDLNKFQNHQFQLPRGGGIRCVGINLVTVFGESAMFQLNNLQIAEGIADDIETIPAGEDSRVSHASNLLSVEGAFLTADVYDTTGMRIATLDQDCTQVSTAGWQPGIYLVKIAGFETVSTQKIMIH